RWRGSTRAGRATLETASLARRARLGACRARTGGRVRLTVRSVARRIGTLSRGGSVMRIRDLSKQGGHEVLLRRWLGAWLDFAVFWLILVLAELLLGSELYERTVVVWVLVALSYFLVSEPLTGKTLGKKLTGLIVVDEEGGLPKVSQVLKRTVTRLFEVNPVLFGGL